MTDENQEKPEILSPAVVQAMVADAAARGYAQGRADQKAESKIPLALMADPLRLMPEGIVDAYGALCVSALSDGMEGRGADPNPRVSPRVTRVRTSTSQVESRGLAPRSKAPYPRGGADVRSSRLLSAKARVDRKLRALAREIEAELNGAPKGDVRKCTRCGRFGEDTWNWCPWDGAQMMSEDRDAER